VIVFEKNNLYKTVEVISNMDVRKNVCLRISRSRVILLLYFKIKKRDIVHINSRKRANLPLTTYHLLVFVPFFIDFSVSDREKTRFVSFFAVFLYLFGKNICLASEKIQKHTSIEVKKDEKA